MVGVLLFVRVDFLRASQVTEVELRLTDCAKPVRLSSFDADLEDRV